MIKMNEQQTGLKESPIEYMVRSASQQHRIPYDTLRNVWGVWLHSDTSGSGYLAHEKIKRNNGLHFHFQVPSLSVTNRQGLILSMGEVISLDFIAYEEGVKIKPILYHKYNFSLYLNETTSRSETRSETSDREIEIAVAHDEILASRIKWTPAPNELFEKGRDYKPALDWMLQQYADGFTPTKM